VRPTTTRLARKGEGRRKRGTKVLRTTTPIRNVIRIKEKGEIDR